MIPKIIHLCWFSNDPYPVEIKVCLDSWQRILPDYRLRVWNGEDARAIGYDFVNEALDARKWAFAADVVRFYAVYTEGGLYMDSDVFLYRRPDDLMEQSGFVTVIERLLECREDCGLQAAFFAGEQGNDYCREILDYYRAHHFRRADGSFDETISPYVMMQAALRRGFEYRDEFQDLGELKVYPVAYLSPSKSTKRQPQAIGVHRIYGSWKKRKLNRRIEIKVKHYWHVVRYALFRR